MADIALVVPPLDGVARADVVASPPLNVPYLAAVSRSMGHEVKIIDCPAFNWDYERLKKEISSFSPDLIGISSLTQTYPAALKSAAAAKDACPIALVVLGGSHVTYMDTETLRLEQGVDVVVRGEGEMTLQDLASNFNDKGKFKEISGITYRKNGEIHKNPDRPFIEDLDSLPFPAYDLIDLSQYGTPKNKHFSMLTSRGCPFKCTFCVMRLMDGSQLRSRSTKNVVDEMEYIKNLGATSVSFCDETFTFNKKGVLDICTEIRKRRINLPWDCQTRVDQVSEDVLSEMKKAGCHYVGFGVESGSQKMLDTMRKGIKIEQAEKAVQLAKRTGLLVGVNMMVGYPGETPDTIKESLHFIKKANPDTVFFMICTPYPGTEYYKLVTDLGWKLDTDWKSYDVVTPVFENPEMSGETLVGIRREFYDQYYSTRYLFKCVLNHALKRNFYTSTLARSVVSYKIRSLKQKLGMR